MLDFSQMPLLKWPMVDEPSLPMVLEGRGHIVRG